MNSIFKKLKKQMNLETILSIILSFVCTFSIMWNCYGINKLVLIVVFFIIFVIVKFIFKFIRNKDLKVMDSKISKKEFFFYFVIIAVPLIISAIAYYPGIATYDTVVQWNQVQTNIYSNWHPVFHTLIFMKLPSLIYNSPISATIFQEIFILMIMMYFCYFCRKYFLNFKQTLFLLILFVFNPLFLKYSVILWKDLPYSWCVFLSTLFFIEIAITKGEWLKKNINKILFILGMTGVLIFRHNGIAPFFIAYLLLIIFYSKYRKFLIVSLVSILSCFMIITHPVYTMLGIDNKTGGKSEMLGEVFGQLSYYYNNNVNFTNEELEFLNSIIPLDLMKEKYNPKSFNDIKNSTPNFYVNVTQNFSKIVQLYIIKSLQNPIMFIKSFGNMTSPIWETKLSFRDIDYNTEAYPYNEFANQRLNISDGVVQKIVSYNIIVTNSPLRWLFVSFGQGFIIILFSIAIVILKKNYKDFIPFTLVVINTLVIMCLITGEEVRFVYSEILCSYPLLLFALFNKDTKDKNRKRNGSLAKIFQRFFIEKTDNTLLQFIRYIFVGGVAAVVNIGMLYVFTDIFKIYYLLSNILSFLLGLIVNFVLSKKLVFQEQTNISKSKEFIIYAIIGVIGLGLDTLFVWIFTDSLKIYYMLSKIISTILVFIWNFGARKLLYKIIK